MIHDGAPCAKATDALAARRKPRTRYDSLFILHFEDDYFCGLRGGFCPEVNGLPAPLHVTLALKEVLGSGHVCRAVPASRHLAGDEGVVHKRSLVAELYGPRQSISWECVGVFGVGSGER